MEAETPGEGGAVGPPADGGAEPRGVDVQEILESMLSKKNLVRDQFLAGNMNPQMYIPVQTLLQHERLRFAGVTHEEVVAAATRSTKLGVDDKQTMVRPLLKSKRNVVILREVPPGTSEDEVRELFIGAPHADRIAHVKPEVNNTWFVKFNLDDGTQEVVLWLRSQKFKGQPVNAAIKSEHFLRSFFPLHVPGQVPAPYMGFMGPRPDAEYTDGAAQDCGAAAAEGGACWAMAGGGPMGFGGKGMLPMPPPPPLLPQEGMQGLGYWQPWGARHQPPPLIFSSPTTLASPSMPVVAQQAAPMGPEIFDNLEEEDDFDGAKACGAKGKGRGKPSKGKGGYGKDGYGKDSYGKDGNGKDGCGKEGYGKDGYAREGYGKDEYGCGKEWGGKDGGGKGWYGGTKDWYALSSNSKATASAWSPAPAEPPQRRKGGKGEKGEQGGDPGDGGEGGAKGKRAAQPRPRAALAGGAEAAGRGVWQPVEAKLPPGGSRGAPAISAYQHDFRRYSREDFVRIAEAVRKEELALPESLGALGMDVPILREAPSVELSAAP